MKDINLMQCVVLTKVLIIYLY